MNSKSDEKSLDMAEALTDPAKVFDHPVDVLTQPGLDSDQRRAILERWLYDARELAVAEEEGMGGGEIPLTERIAKALQTLDGEPMTPAHKQ